MYELVAPLDKYRVFFHTSDCKSVSSLFSYGARTSCSVLEHPLIGRSLKSQHRHNGQHNGLTRTSHDSCTLIVVHIFAGDLLLLRS